MSMGDDCCRATSQGRCHSHIFTYLPRYRKLEGDRRLWRSSGEEKKKIHRSDIPDIYLYSYKAALDLYCVGALPRNANT